LPSGSRRSWASAVRRANRKDLEALKTRLESPAP
jgi:hypothetical protein